MGMPCMVSLSSRRYVHWHSLKDPNQYAYSVQLEQVGTEVRCLVGRCK